jgi:hypothetical protein
MQFPSRFNALADHGRGMAEVYRSIPRDHEVGSGRITIEVKWPRLQRLPYCTVVVLGIISVPNNGAY